MVDTYNLYQLQGRIHRLMNVLFILHTQNFSIAHQTKAGALITAVLQADINTVKNLLHAGFNVNYKDEEEQTALHYAIQLAHLEIASLLFTSPQTVLSKIISSIGTRFKDKNGNTLLHQAVLLAAKVFCF